VNTELLNFFNILVCAAYIVALVIVGRIIKSWSELNTVFHEQLKNMNELTIQGDQLKREYTKALAELNDARLTVAAYVQRGATVPTGTSTTIWNGTAGHQTEPVR